MSRAAPALLRTRLSRLPWWLLGLASLGVLLLGRALSDPTILSIAQAVALGLATTIRVTVIAYAASLVLGTSLGLGLASRRLWLNQAVRAYVEVMRGVPILVLLYAIAFAIVPVLVSWYAAAFADPIARGALPALSVRDVGFEGRAILALTLAYSAFIAEVMRGGIDGVPAGQSEAAQALGLSRGTAMRLVILPQAFRAMLPPLGNDLVSMLKDSSLVSVLGVADITQIGKTYSAATFLFFETYLVVAVFYLAMTIGLSMLVRRLERRLGRHARR